MKNTLKALVPFALVGTVVSVLLIAACSALAPPINPKDWPPCGHPRMHSCPVRVDGDIMCCWDGEDCGGWIEFPGCPAGMCCNSRGLAVRRQTKVDAGP